MLECECWNVCGFERTVKGSKEHSICKKEYAYNDIMCVCVGEVSWIMSNIYGAQ